MNKRTSSNTRLDEQVYLTMGALCVLSVLILAFRYASGSPCSPVSIRSNNSSFIKGTPVRFVAETQGGKSFEWDFGDGAITKEYATSTQHTYIIPGHYTVSVIVNGECSDLQNIIVKDAPVVVTNFQPTILVDDTGYINQPIIVEDASINSTSWEWRFEEGGAVDATDRKATHTYTTAGTKKIFLQVNGRPDLQTARSITVIDRNAQKAALAKFRQAAYRPQPQVIILPAKPSTDPLSSQQAQAQEQPKKPEEKPKAPEVSEDQMANLLKAVNEGSKTPEDFSSYLCGNLSTPVFYNGNKMTFAKLCEELKSSIKKGKIKKISVGLTRDQSNCIISMVVTVDKKKGFLGL
jgi:hypothetical protein